MNIFHVESNSSLQYGKPTRYVTENENNEIIDGVIVHI